MSQNKPDFKELLAATRHSAVHLEMRDVYGVGDESADFSEWKRSGRRDTDPGSEYWAPWVDLISGATARGVVVRRARVVSEPVTDYIRYEHAGAGVNVHAGEQVRWLARRNAATLMLPGSDLWIFDSATVMFNHFGGEGNWAEPRMELRSEADVVKQCVDAFEAVWERAVPHGAYEIR
ncbi:MULTISPECIES: DUF6879 family protein [unclassified Streptomyces]|uniref:DUF6879 family protein n=1 Tax=unclassified Streptomyces TaxID=2593676 RepID=UPI003631056E